MNAFWLLLAMHAASDAPAPIIENCQPIWVTITAEATQLERDFSGCKGGDLTWSPPEAWAFDTDIYTLETARYGTVSARPMGEQVEVRFQPRDGDKELTAILAMGAEGTVDGYTVRLRSGGEPTIAIQAKNVSVREVAVAIAALQDATLIGAEHLGEQGVTFNFQSISATSVWALIGDVGEVYARYWPEENTVRIWPGETPDAAIKPGLRMATPSTAAMPNLPAVYAMQAAAEQACAADPPSCVAAHQQLLAYTDSFATIVRDMRLESLLALIAAQAPNGSRDAAAQADRNLVAHLQKYPPASSTLEYLQTAIDLPAPKSSEALASLAEAQINASPPQQVRLRAIALAALTLQMEADQSDAFERLQRLQERYMTLDLALDDTDPALLPIDLGDEQLTLARTSVGRAASRVADALLKREQWVDASYALFVAANNSDDPGLIRLTEVRMARVLIRLGQLDSALAMVERIDCGDNVPVCEIESDLRPALLLALNRTSEARSAWVEIDQCPLRNASDRALLDALGGENPPLPKSGSDCGLRGTLAELVLDALPDAAEPWQHRLLAESYLSRYVARGDETFRTVARQHFDAALTAAADEQVRTVLKARIARLDQAR